MLALLVPGVQMGGGNTGGVIYIAGTWFEPTRPLNWYDAGIGRGVTWTPLYVSA